MKFRKSELAEEVLELANKRAKFDSQNTINGAEQYKGGRSNETIFQHALQGQIAEAYLMLEIGLEDCLKKYHDLKYKEKIVEVKTSVNIQRLEEQYVRMQKASWNNSDIFLGFQVKENGDLYELVINRNI